MKVKHVASCFCLPVECLCKVERTVQFWHGARTETKKKMETTTKIWWKHDAIYYFFIHFLLFLLSMDYQPSVASKRCWVGSHTTKKYTNNNNKSKILNKYGKWSGRCIAVNRLLHSAALSLVVFAISLMPHFHIYLCFFSIFCLFCLFCLQIRVGYFESVGQRYDLDLHAHLLV